MSYLQSRYADSDLDDDAAHARDREIVLAYNQRLATIRARLPDELFELAQVIDVHDALPVLVAVDHARRAIVVELIIGDLRVGYSDLKLSYGDVRMCSLDIPLLQSLAQSSRSELLDHEIDVLPGGTLSHSLLWWPRHRIATIQFGHFSFSVSPRENRHREFRSSRFYERGRAG